MPANTCTLPPSQPLLRCSESQIVNGQRLLSRTARAVIVSTQPWQGYRSNWTAAGLTVLNEDFFTYEESGVVGGVADEDPAQ